MIDIKYQISLSKKFILYSSTIVFIVFFYLSYLFIKENSAQNNQAILDLSAEVSFAEKIFDDSARYATLILNSMINDISKDPENKNHISNVLKSFHVLHDSKMKDILSISMFSWVDKKDILAVNSEIGVLSKNLDLSSRDYLQLTKKDPNKLYFGKPVAGAVSTQYIIPAGIGLIDGKGEYQGSVIMGFDIDSIYQKFLKGKILIGSNLQIIYKNEFGVIQNSPDFGKEYLAKINLENPNPQILKQSSIFGSPLILVYQRITNTPYGVLVSFENLNQPSIVKKTYLLEFLCILLFFIVLIYLLKKDFINPIVLLSKEAESVGLGRFDIRTPKSNILEINQLSKSILSIKHFVKTEQDLKNQLDIANQKLHSLLKSISHDLRNYVSGISGLAEIIAEDKKLTKENVRQDQQYAQMISKQSVQILSFAKDALNTQSDQLGIIKLDQDEDCDIKELIEEMLVLNQQFLKSQQVKITTDFQKDLPILRCDQRRLRQVLDNLITNAVKYSNKGGEVKISGQKVEDNQVKQIQITIQDNGIGMTKDDIKAALMGEGKNIDKSDLDKPIDSHGIGMQIVQQVIKAIGAKMEIESEKGQGTIVKLWFNIDEASLPADQNLVELPESMPTKKKPSASKPKTILIVDDEEVNLLVLGKVLTDANYKIIKAKNGQEALEILDEKKCDLIFMDVKMPKLDGLKTTKIIREGGLKNKKYQAIPIIAISGDDDEQSRKAALKSGMNEIVGKPFVKAEILNLVAKFL
ncbi:MAG: response regulator [Pseudomonadota bacterium]